MGRGGPVLASTEALVNSLKKPLVSYMCSSLRVGNHFTQRHVGAPAGLELIAPSEMPHALRARCPLSESLYVQLLLASAGWQGAENSLLTRFTTLAA